MKKISNFLSWLFPFSLLALLVLSFIWQGQLAISESNHQWICVGLVIIFYLLVNFWISKNPTFFLVGEEYQDLDESEKRSKGCLE
jgi:uncharacterized membrane protein